MNEEMQKRLIEISSKFEIKQEVWYICKKWNYVQKATIYGFTPNSIRLRHGGNHCTRNENQIYTTKVEAQEVLKKLNENVKQKINNKEIEKMNNYRMTDEQIRLKRGMIKENESKDYYFDEFEFFEAHSKFLEEWILPLNNGKKHKENISSIVVSYIMGILDDKYVAGDMYNK